MAAVIDLEGIAAHLSMIAAKRSRARSRTVGVLLAAMGCGTAIAEPTILSGYRDIMAPGRQRMREGPHPAIDFAGNIGDPVLAAAPGVVVQIARAASGGDCGNGIRLHHEEIGRFTLYCQLDEVHVKRGERVARGQVIGLLGDSGEPRRRTEACAPRCRPIPMLHFELASDARRRGDGDLEGTFDPLPYIVGCFDPAKTYPTDRVALTYPVRCKD